MKPLLAKFRDVGSEGWNREEKRGKSGICMPTQSTGHWTTKPPGVKEPQGRSVIGWRVSVGNYMWIKVQLARWTRHVMQTPAARRRRSPCLALSLSGPRPALDDPWMQCTVNSCSGGQPLTRTIGGTHRLARGPSRDGRAPGLCSEHGKFQLVLESVISTPTAARQFTTETL
jgi:hypothetical protein